MEVKIQVPDSVITAAGYKATAGESGTTTYTVDPSLPKYITLPVGAADEKGNLIVAGSAVVYAPENGVFASGADDTATFTFEVKFGWGELFQNENPGKYLDNEISDKQVNNTDALLAIAKAENAGAGHTELTAEAKRDILTAMKKAIAVSEAKFTVVVNAQAK